MRTLLKISAWLIGIVAAIYIAVCSWFYFSQDEIIFQGTRHSADYRYQFQANYEEYNIKTIDGNILNGGLFKASKTKGLVFYLHGNGGALDSWANVADHYNQLGYDVFILDYPGYGKSTGSINSQQQLFDAVKTAYDRLKIVYAENEIIVLGYSIGTGPASWLASQVQCKKLILLAPYYSLADEAKTLYPFLPRFILKYPISTYQYIQQVIAPVIIFHGDSDELINHNSSVRLQKFFKAGDQLITLKGQQHNGIDENSDYQEALKKIL